MSLLFSAAQRTYYTSMLGKRLSEETWNNEFLEVELGGFAYTDEIWWLLNDHDVIEWNFSEINVDVIIDGKVIPLNLNDGFTIEAGNHKLEFKLTPAGSERIYEFLKTEAQAESFSIKISGMAKLEYTAPGRVEHVLEVPLTDTVIEIRDNTFDSEPLVNIDLDSEISEDALVADEVIAEISIVDENGNNIDLNSITSQEISLNFDGRFVAENYYTVEVSNATETIKIKLNQDGIEYIQSKVDEGESANFFVSARFVVEHGEPLASYDIKGDSTASITGVEEGGENSDVVENLQLVVNVEYSDEFEDSVIFENSLANMDSPLVTISAFNDLNEDGAYSPEAGENTLDLNFNTPNAINVSLSGGDVELIKGAHYNWESALINPQAPLKTFLMLTQQGKELLAEKITYDQTPEITTSITVINNETGEDVKEFISFKVIGSPEIVLDYSSTIAENIWNTDEEKLEDSDLGSYEDEVFMELTAKALTNEHTENGALNNGSFSVNLVNSEGGFYPLTQGVHFYYLAETSEDGSKTFEFYLTEIGVNYIQDTVSPGETLTFSVTSAFNYSYSGGVVTEQAVFDFDVTETDTDTDTGDDKSIELTDALVGEVDGGDQDEDGVVESVIDISGDGENDDTSLATFIIKGYGDNLQDAMNNNGLRIVLDQNLADDNEAVTLDSIQAFETNGYIELVGHEDTSDGLKLTFQIKKEALDGYDEANLSLKQTIQLKDAEDANISDDIVYDIVDDSPPVENDEPSLANVDLKFGKVDDDAQDDRNDGDRTDPELKLSDLVDDQGEALEQVEIASFSVNNIPDGEDFFDGDGYYLTSALEVNGSSIAEAVTVLDGLYNLGLDIVKIDDGNYKLLILQDGINQLLERGFDEIRELTLDIKISKQGESQVIDLKDYVIDYSPALETESTAPEINDLDDNYDFSGGEGTVEIDDFVKLTDDTTDVITLGSNTRIETISVFSGGEDISADFSAGDLRLITLVNPGGVKITTGNQVSDKMNEIRDSLTPESDPVIISYKITTTDEDGNSTSKNFTVTISHPSNAVDEAPQINNLNTDNFINEDTESDWFFDDKFDVTDTNGDTVLVENVYVSNLIVSGNLSGLGITVDDVEIIGDDPSNLSVAFKNETIKTAIRELLEEGQQAEITIEITAVDTDDSNLISTKKSTLTITGVADEETNAVPKFVDAENNSIVEDTESDWIFDSDGFTITDIEDDEAGLSITPAINTENNSITITGEGGVDLSDISLTADDFELVEVSGKWTLTLTNYDKIGEIQDALLNDTQAATIKVKVKAIDSDDNETVQDFSLTVRGEEEVLVEKSIKLSDKYYGLEDESAYNIDYDDGDNIDEDVMYVEESGNEDTQVFSFDITGYGNSFEDAYADDDNGGFWPASGDDGLILSVFWADNPAVSQLLHPSMIFGGGNFQPPIEWSEVEIEGGFRVSFTLTGDYISDLLYKNAQSSEYHSNDIAFILYDNQDTDVRDEVAWTAISNDDPEISEIDDNSVDEDESMEEWKLDPDGFTVFEDDFNDEAGVEISEISISGVNVSISVDDFDLITEANGNSNFVLNNEVVYKAIQDALEAGDKAEITAKIVAKDTRTGVSEEKEVTLTINGKGEEQEKSIKIHEAYYGFEGEDSERPYLDDGNEDDALYLKSEGNEETKIVSFDLIGYGNEFTRDAYEEDYLIFYGTQSIPEDTLFHPEYGIKWNSSEIEGGFRLTLSISGEFLDQVAEGGVSGGGGFVIIDAHDSDIIDRIGWDYIVNDAPEIDGIDDNSVDEDESMEEWKLDPDGFTVFEDDFNDEAGVEISEISISGVNVSISVDDFDLITEANGNFNFVLDNEDIYKAIQDALEAGDKAEITAKIVAKDTRTGVSEEKEVALTINGKSDEGEIIPTIINVEANFGVDGDDAVDLYNDGDNTDSQITYSDLINVDELVLATFEIDNLSEGYSPIATFASGSTWSNGSIVIRNIEGTNQYEVVLNQDGVDALIGFDDISTGKLSISLIDSNGDNVVGSVKMIHMDYDSSEGRPTITNIDLKFGVEGDDDAGSDANYNDSNEDPELTYGDLVDIDSSGNAAPVDELVLATFEADNIPDNYSIYASFNGFNVDEDSDSLIIRKIGNDGDAYELVLKGDGIETLLNGGSKQSLLVIKVLDGDGDIVEDSGNVYRVDYDDDEGRPDDEENTNPEFIDVDTAVEIDEGDNNSAWTFDNQNGFDVTDAEDGNIDPVIAENGVTVSGVSNLSLTNDDLSLVKEGGVWQLKLDSSGIGKVKDALTSEDQSLTISVKLVATDNDGGTAEQVFTLTINGEDDFVNSAPTFNDLEDHAINENAEDENWVVDNDGFTVTDADNDNLTVSVVEVNVSGDNQAISILESDFEAVTDSNGNVINFILNSDKADEVRDQLEGDESISINVIIEANDNTGSENSIKREDITLIVNGENDEPIIIDLDGNNIAEDVESDLWVLDQNGFNVSDDDSGDDLTVSISNISTNGISVTRSDFTQIPFGENGEKINYQLTDEAIARIQGELELGETLNIEVEVQVSDETDVTKEKATLTVTGVKDETTPEFNGLEDNQISEIYEDWTIDGKFEAKDEDGDNVTVSVEGISISGDVGGLSAIEIGVEDVTLSQSSNGSYSLVFNNEGMKDQIRSLIKEDDYAEIKVSLKASDGNGNFDAEDVVLKINGMSYQSDLSLAEANFGMRGADQTSEYMNPKWDDGDDDPEMYLRDASTTSNTTIFTFKSNDTTLQPSEFVAVATIHNSDGSLGGQDWSQKFREGQDSYVEIVETSTEGVFEFNLTPEGITYFRGLFNQDDLHLLKFHVSTEGDENPYNDGMTMVMHMVDGNDTSGESDGGSDGNGGGSNPPVDDEPDTTAPNIEIEELMHVIPENMLDTSQVIANFFAREPGGWVQNENIEITLIGTDKGDGSASFTYTYDYENSVADGAFNIGDDIGIERCANHEFKVRLTEQGVAKIKNELFKGEEIDISINIKVTDEAGNSSFVSTRPILRVNGEGEEPTVEPVITIDGTIPTEFKEMDVDSDTVLLKFSVSGDTDFDSNNISVVSISEEEPGEGSSDMLLQWNSGLDVPGQLDLVVTEVSDGVFEVKFSQDAIDYIAENDLDIGEILGNNFSIIATDGNGTESAPETHSVEIIGGEPTVEPVITIDGTIPTEFKEMDVDSDTVLLKFSVSGDTDFDSSNISILSLADENPGDGSAGMILKWNNEFDAGSNTTFELVVTETSEGMFEVSLPQSAIDFIAENDLDIDEILEANFSIIATDGNGTESAPETHSVEIIGEELSDGSPVIEDETIVYSEDEDGVDDSGKGADVDGDGEYDYYDDDSSYEDDKLVFKFSVAYDPEDGEVDEYIISLGNFTDSNGDSVSITKASGDVYNYSVNGETYEIIHSGDKNFEIDKGSVQGLKDNEVVSFEIPYNVSDRDGNTSNDAVAIVNIVGSSNDDEDNKDPIILDDVVEYSEDKNAQDNSGIDADVDGDGEADYSDGDSSLGGEGELIFRFSDAYDPEDGVVSSYIIEEGNFVDDNGDSYLVNKVSNGLYEYKVNGETYLIRHDGSAEFEIVQSSVMDLEKDEVMNFEVRYRAADNDQNKSEVAVAKVNVIGGEGVIEGPDEEGPSIVMDDQVIAISERSFTTETKLASFEITDNKDSDIPLENIQLIITTEETIGDNSSDLAYGFNLGADLIPEWVNVVKNGNSYDVYLKEEAIEHIKEELDIREFMDVSVGVSATDEAGNETVLEGVVTSKVSGYSTKQEIIDDIGGGDDDSVIDPPADGELIYTYNDMGSKFENFAVEYAPESDILSARIGTAHHEDLVSFWMVLNNGGMPEKDGSVAVAYINPKDNMISFYKYEAQKIDDPKENDAFGAWMKEANFIKSYEGAMTITDHEIPYAGGYEVDSDIVGKYEMSYKTISFTIDVSDINNLDAEPNVIDGGGGSGKWEGIQFDDNIGVWVFEDKDGADYEYGPNGEILDTNMRTNKTVDDENNSPTTQRTGNISDNADNGNSDVDSGDSDGGGLIIGDGDDKSIGDRGSIGMWSSLGVTEESNEAPIIELIAENSLIDSVTLDELRDHLESNNFVIAELKLSDDKSLDDIEISSAKVVYGSNDLTLTSPSHFRVVKDGDVVNIEITDDGVNKVSDSIDSSSEMLTLGFEVIATDLEGESSSVSYEVSIDPPVNTVVEEEEDSDSEDMVVISNASEEESAEIEILSTGQAVDVDMADMFAFDNDTQNLNINGTELELSSEVDIIIRQPMNDSNSLEVDSGNLGAENSFQDIFDDDESDVSVI